MHTTLHLISPSGHAHDRTVMQRGVARLREVGFRVDGLEVLDRAVQRFAGTDAERAQDINALATDTASDIALATRGGYGAARILPMLDYDALRERADTLPLLVGHSDFTAIQLALYARAGVQSFSGPLLADLGTEAPDATTWKQFLATLGASSMDTAWITAPGTELDVRGTLWGGNLAVLCSLLGTPYFPAIDDGILFVEDLGEPPYRIERLLYQLHLSGVLGRQRALLLGGFSDCRPGPRDNGYHLADTFAQLRKVAGIDVVDGLPHGHGTTQLTLPFGATAQLQVVDGTARLTASGYRNVAVPMA